MTTIDTITDEQIDTLRTEAGAAGDLDTVATCDRALAGDRAARVECAGFIADAEAQVEREDAEDASQREALREEADRLDAEHFAAVAMHAVRS